jgi:hypothetical protein
MLCHVALTRASRHNIPEDTILHSHRRENLKFYMNDRRLLNQHLWGSECNGNQSWLQIYSHSAILDIDNFFSCICLRKRTGDNIHMWSQVMCDFLNPDAIWNTCNHPYQHFQLADGCFSFAGWWSYTWPDDRVWHKWERLCIGPSPKQVTQGFAPKPWYLQ